MGLRYKFGAGGFALLATVLSNQFCIGSVYGQNLTSFRIANGTSGENPAVLWVGVDQGFYRKHGLNVEVIFMRSGPFGDVGLGLFGRASGFYQLE